MYSSETESQNSPGLVYLDDLTGLFNRRYLYFRLPELLSECGMLSLFMIDLDGFKNINDTYGHLEGDTLLVEFSKILKDSIGKGGIAVRYAGDEFTVILPNIAKEEGVSIAKSLLENVSRQPLKGRQKDTQHAVRMSLGLAVYPEDARETQEIIEKADRALYSSKKTGKNRVSTTGQIMPEIALFDSVRENLSSPKFINRQEELLKLQGFVTEASGGRKKGLVICGESGIGKTRLLDEFLTALRPKGASFMKLRCTQEDLYKPYGILKESLTGNLKGPKREETLKFLLGLEKGELAELANLVPYIKEALSKRDIEYVSEEKNRRVNIFRGFARLFKQMAGGNPFILAIDDLHWIDTGSLAVIYSLLKDTNSGLLLCATFLEDAKINFQDSLSLSPFGGLRLSLEYKELFEEIPLGPLKAEQTKELILSIFTGMEPSDYFIQVISASAEGNPFVLLELLKASLDKGIIYFEEGRWLFKAQAQKDIPSSFEEIKKSQFEKSDNEVKEFLANASSLGDSFRLDIMKKIFNMNEGYLLDVIDRAGKLGVIRAKDFLNVEEFNFVNSRTKEAFYNFVDKPKAKELHKNIARHLEDYYRDDLDRVSANILAHYRLAEDSSKAAEYADRLSANQDYQEITSYIDNMVKEEPLVSVEEALEKPLSPQSQQLLFPAMFSLRAAIANALLYNPSNQTRINSQNEAYQNLSRILEHDLSLTFSDAAGELLINGEEIGNKGTRKTLGFAFASLLSDHRVASITFKAGLTAGEFVFFVDQLSRPDEETSRKGGIAKIFKENKISSIKINEVRYEKVSRGWGKLKNTKEIFKDFVSKDQVLQSLFDPNKGEVVLNQAVHQLELKDIIKSLNAMIREIAGWEGDLEERADMVLDALRKIGGQIAKVYQDEWDKSKGNISSSILSLPPKLLFRVIEKDLALSEGSGDIACDILSAAADSDIVEAIVKIFESKKLSQADILLIFKTLLSDPGKKERLVPLIEAELARRGIPPKQDFSYLLAKELKEGDGKIIEDIIRETQASEVKKNLANQIAGNMKPVIESLVSKNREDLIVKTVQKVSQDLDSPTADVRGNALRGLSDIADTLLDKEKFVDLVLKDISGILIDRLRKEEDIKIYGLITSCLGRLVGGLIYKENYKAAGEVIKVLREELLPAVSRLPSQQKCAQEAIKSLSSLGIVEFLVTAFSKKIESESADITNILGELGENTIGPLLELLEEDPKKDPFEVYRSKRNVVMILGKMGKTAVSKLKEKLSDKRPFVVRNIIEVLRYINDEETIPALGGLIKHPNLQVRKELIVTLRKLGGLESLKLLISALHDADEEIRGMALEAISDLGNKEMLSELKKYFSDSTQDQEIYRRIIERISKK